MTSVFAGRVIEEKTVFLDASSHLYQRVCPSVGSSVGPSVGNAFFFLNSEIEELS